MPLLNSKALYSYFATAISALVGLASALLINRYSGVGTFGQVSIYLSLITIVYSFLGFGTQEVVTRMYSLFEGKNEVLITGVLLDIVSFILSAFIIYICLDPFINFLNIDIGVENRLIVLGTLFFMFLKSSINGYLKSQDSIKIINNMLLIDSLSKLISLYILLNCKIGQEMSILNYIIIGPMLSFIYGAFLIRNCFKYSFDKVQFKAIFFATSKLASKYFLSSSFKSGFKNVDVFIIQKYIGLEAVGLYQTHVKLLLPLQFLTVPLNPLFQMKLTRLADRKDSVGLVKLIFQISKRIFVVGIILVVLLIIFYPHYLGLNNLTVDEKPIFYLLTIINFLPLLNWWSGAFMLSYRPDIPVYTNLAASFLNIVVPILGLSYFYEPTLTVYASSILLIRIFTYPVSFIFLFKFVKGEKNSS